MNAPRYLGDRRSLIIDSGEDVPFRVGKVNVMLIVPGPFTHAPDLIVALGD